MAERTLLGRLVVLTSADPIDVVTVDTTAEELLALIEWERFGVPVGSMEWEVFLHREAVPGYVLCDGTGRQLVTDRDWVTIQRLLPGCQHFDLMPRLPRGLNSVTSFLMGQLEKDLSFIERLG